MLGRKIRHTLFAPAVALLNQLTYPQKFALLSCVLLLPLGVAILSLHTEIQRQIDFSEAERSGLRLLRPMQALQMEVLRNLDSATTTPTTVEKSWQRLVKTERPLSAQLGTREILQELERNRTNANQQGELKVNVRDNLEQLRMKVASESNLILDPVSDSYYLVDALINRLPRIQTDLSLIAWIMDRYGDNPSPSSRSRLITLAEELREYRDALRKSLDTARRASRGGRLDYTLKPALNQLNNKIDAIILPLELLAFPQLQVNISGIDEASRAALQFSDHYWQRTASELDHLLKERVEALKEKQWNLAIVVLASLSLALYLYIGLYRSIMETISSLREASRRMVDGIQAGSVELQTADEMGMVVRSFNRVADALRQAEANYRSIFENALEGIFQTSREGVFLMANPRLANILGYSSPGELISSIKDIGNNLYVSPQRRKDFLREIRQDGMVLEFESEVRRRDGSCIWISETARTITNENGDVIGFEGTVIDVTQRRLDAAEIERLTNSLKDENLRLGAELSVTRKLQEMLMPSTEELNTVEDLEISGYMEPADEVGGDYYDIQRANGRTRFSIGDVTGHGLESSLVMIMAQTAVRTLLSNGETDPARLLNAVNRTIYDNTRRMGSAKNMTLSLLEYIPGSLRLSGQHEDLIIVRSNGTVEQVDTFPLGFPLGLESDISQYVSEMEVPFSQGDIAVLYTDGITEAMNSNRSQYGVDRMVHVIRSRRSQGALEICQAIIADVKAWIETQRLLDDITLLVLKKPLIREDNPSLIDN